MLNYLLLVGRVAHSLAVDGHLSRFDGSECEVLFSALRYFSIANEDIRASNKTLAETAGVSDATCSRSLLALSAKGYLVGAPGHWKLGPILVAILQSHMRVVNLTSCSPSEASNNNGSPVSLSETQERVCGRKGCGSLALAKLVEVHGSELVDQAILMMEAQYPDDSQVKSSFAALVSRACEHKWVCAKREQAVRREQEAVAIAESSPPETAGMVITPDGQRLPVVGRLASGAIQVVIERRGRKETVVIPPSQFPGLKWEFLAVTRA